MKIRITAWLGLCAAVSWPMPAQTHIDLRTQSKSADLSSIGATKPAQSGSVLPATCGIGEVFFLTSAAPGQNLMVCAGANQWSASGGGGGSLAAQANGSPLGTATTLDLVPGTYVFQTVTCTAGTCSYQPDVDTTKIPTNAAIQAGQLKVVITTSTSSTTYTGVMAANDPLAAYVANQELIWNVGATACAGGAMTFNIDGLGAIPLKEADGSTNLNSAYCAANQILGLAYDANNTVFRVVAGGPSSASSSPVTTTLTPFGGIDGGYGNATLLSGTANAVWYAQVMIPAPGIVLNKIKGFQPSGGNVGHMAMGIYDSSCSLVGQSSTVTGGSAQQSVAFSFSALSLVGGSYFVAFSSDNGSSTFFSASGAGYLGYVWNTGESASTYRLFLGSNASTTASNVTTMPSTCGIRTALNSSSGTSYLPSLTLD